MRVGARFLSLKEMENRSAVLCREKKYVNEFGTKE